MRVPRLLSAAVLGLVLALAVLEGCGRVPQVSLSPSPVATHAAASPVPRPTPSPARSPLPASTARATPAPSPFPRPTATVAPTATAVPSPTQRPAATATPSPTATAAPTATPSPPPALPTVRVAIGEAAFVAEVADRPATRTRGLSGRESLAPGAGMLFVFESSGEWTFWMIDMKFPLDFIWIGRDCQVVDLTLNVPAPAPGTPASELPLYSPSSPAMYTLEVNAGEVERHGIRPGDRVRFEGGLPGAPGACAG